MRITPARHFMLKPSAAPMPRSSGSSDSTTPFARRVSTSPTASTVRPSAGWRPSCRRPGRGARRRSKLLVGEALLGNECATRTRSRSWARSCLLDATEHRARSAAPRPGAQRLRRQHRGRPEPLRRRSSRQLRPDDAEGNICIWAIFYALQNDLERAPRSSSRPRSQTDFDYLLQRLQPVLRRDSRGLRQTYDGRVPPAARRSATRCQPPKWHGTRADSLPEQRLRGADATTRGTSSRPRSANQSSEGQTPLLMLSLVKATQYEPASLNGIRVPALVDDGHGSVRPVDSSPTASPGPARACRAVSGGSVERPHDRASGVGQVGRRKQGSCSPFFWS